MKVTHRKGGTVYVYRGDLRKEIEKCKNELDKKLTAPERQFLKWQKDRAVAAYEAYEERIAALKDFIRIAENDLRNRENGEQK